MIRILYIPISTPPNECKYHALQIYSNKKEVAGEQLIASTICGVCLRISCITQIGTLLSIDRDVTF